ncbi:MAG: type IV pilus secretin PilQ [Deltaproteobacteria bacterium]|nr:type IV pilus secretin PilQ [Deltaproteobacteria bacterium]
MLDTKCPRRGNLSLRLITIGLLCVILSCARTPTTKKAPGLAPEGPARIESIKVVSLPSEQATRVAITSSKAVPYTTFKLVQPLRIVVDVSALPTEGLTGPDVSKDGIIKAIAFERMDDKSLVTRVTATLYEDVEYSVQEKDGIIDILLSSKKPYETVGPPAVASKEEAVAQKKPRLFFAPGKTKLNQILGIDFFMLPKNKSRVTITTREKAVYELSRKDPLTLLLEIKDVTIRPELTRYIDSSHFRGVVNRITPIVRAPERSVAFEIQLKEMVPYHLMGTEQEIRLDFNKTSVKPPAKTITVARLAKTTVEPEQIPREAEPVVGPPRVPKPKKYRKYTGERITLDFANADIKNILKLIGEVSKLNLVWGPEVKGTVSMRLKNKEGNIIWITTKGKIRNLEKERQEKLKAQQESIKAAKAAMKEAEEAEPLVTAYITVNYADVGDIKKLIEENVKGPRGKLSVDTRGKTIIFTDIASNIKEARALKKRQDTPIKQVMIEARVVEAKTTFSRSLGVNWTGTYQSPWGGGGPGNNYRYDFATNFTALAGSTFDIGFTSATMVLNARITLGETEGKLKTISAPKIITQDNQRATIKQGTTLYIPYTDIEGNRTAKEVDATLELNVTPKITPNNMVTMDITVNDDFPDYANRVGEYVPILTKSATTKMMIASGDTVVIGGIYKEAKGVSNEGTPWFRKIPLLGWFFGTESKVVEKSELLIFLTPRVVPFAPTS